MRILRLLFSLLLLSPVCWGAFQSSDKGTTSANFLKLGVSARAVAMGEAYSAVTDDANALYWNPAGLTRIDKQSVALNHSAYLDSSFHDYAAYAQKLGQQGAFGVGLNYFSSGKITETDETSADVGDLNPNDSAFAVGYARSFAGLSVGLSAKYIHSKIVDSADTVAMDGGLLTPILAEKFRIGFSFSNLGGKLKYENEEENLPLLLRLGSSCQLTTPWLVSLDVTAPKDNQPYWAVGTEYKFFNHDNLNLTGRAGYNSKTMSDGDGLTGASFGMGLGLERFSFDYAFLPFGSLGLTHYLSFNFR